MEMDHKPSPVSRLKDFQFISGDILKLIAYKSQFNDKNSQRELAVIESFYDQCHALISNAGLDTQAARLAATTEHFKAVCLEKELKGVYNEVYLKDQGLCFDLITKSHIPTKKELDSDVVIRPVTDAQ